jgi:cell wall assembly regulator SMI1
MQAIWTRIESWLEANAPEVLKTLNPGASEEQIKAVEDTLLIQFPDDFKSSYRIHNGQSLDGGWLIDGREFLSLERIQEEWLGWKMLLDGKEFEGWKSLPEPGVRPDWWNALWIPITFDGAGNHHCLDLDPAPGGKVGQIIYMWHDDLERGAIAASFQDWLEGYATALEAGQYVFSEEYDAIVDVDDI